MNSVISVENLSKAYRIGLEEKRSDTLSGAIAQVLKSPLRNFRTIANLNSTSDSDGSLFWALRGVNFEVKQGEVLGIIGHNGAGKSTLLKILSRITEPTEGKVTIRGRVSSLLEVGTGFHPDLTGRENIYMNGTILGMTKREIDSKLEEIIEFSGVRKHIDTPVKRYSSGMTVRLAFSVAAHLEPEILIIDEVLAVGDIEFQKKCMGKMNAVAKQGRTVIFVSHNLTAVSSLCTRVIWMNKGTLKMEGEPQHVIGEYLASNEPEESSTSWQRQESFQGQKVSFRRISLADTDNGFLPMNSALTFDFDIDSSIEHDGFQICIRVYDTNSTMLTCLYNTDFSIPLRLKIGTNQFVLRIPENNLLPGEYSFSFSATYNYGSEIFDFQDKVLRISLVESDVTGSGIALREDRGMVWFKITT